MSYTTCRIDSRHRAERTPGGPICIDGCVSDDDDELADVHDPAPVVNTDPEWPQPLGEDAYYGLIGEFTRLWEPHTEADPAALLVQGLVAAGNWLGRWPYRTVGPVEHYGNLFMALVGKTSRGRKGTSWGPVKALFTELDPEWRIRDGLSSGEGLIWNVRDPVDDKDDGIVDKRLMVVEGELALVLARMQATGNSLSAVLRNAWDSGVLGTLTTGRDKKKPPVTARNAHVSMIGHITAEELKRTLTATEMVNGWANRVLWVCAQRSKLLPHGGSLGDDALAGVRGRLRDARLAARRMGRVGITRDAEGLWEAAYIQELSREVPGLLGAVTGRAEAQVLRMAMLYAVLDIADQVDVPHLLAALEVWRYCFDSARYIFGDSLGSPVADELLALIRSNADTGVSKTDIRNAFSGHKTKETAAALRLLLDHHLVDEVSVKTGGRDRTVYFPIRDVA